MLLDIGFDVEKVNCVGLRVLCWQRNATHWLIACILYNNG